jgi:hypothetical protein
MDRRQREEELRTMLTSQRGKEELLATLKKHAGMEEGNLPPFGTLLVETILNYEYAPEGTPEQGAGAGAGVESRGASKPASEKVEPGDVKFDQPPAQEVPGG